MVDEVEEPAWTRPPRNSLIWTKMVSKAFIFKTLL